MMLIQTYQEKSASEFPKLMRSHTSNKFLFLAIAQGQHPFQYKGHVVESQTADFPKGDFHTNMDGLSDYTGDKSVKDFI